MIATDSDLRRSFLRRALRPIARFCLRRAIKLQDFLECSKEVFLEIAEEEIEHSGQAVSISRLSVMTGVHRPDVKRLTKENLPREKSSQLSRVISQWERDSRFRRPSGRPRTLTVSGEESEFFQLVKSVSNDLNPYTILFELERVGVIVRTRNGVKLEKRVYIPKGNAAEGLSILAKDTDDLFRSVEENLENNESLPNLHLRTEYDNIPSDYALGIRKWLINEGTKLHQRAREYLSRLDRDYAPALPNYLDRTRVILSSFSLVEDQPKKDIRKKENC